MKKNVFDVGYRFLIFSIGLLFFIPLSSYAQQSILINLAPIDGVAITPDNVFNYQVQSYGSGSVMIKGIIRYRNSGMNLSYTFNTTLVQGMNVINEDASHAQWQFSSSALQELFNQYKVLPEGTFEYCVTVTPINFSIEKAGTIFQECLYYRAKDFFLINLIDPENKAKIREYNPLLSWVANYSFSNELTYRIRVAEIKQGQNTVNAIMRNQPLYDEKNLMQNSIVYPLYAKPLIANQPYAWTVDAYYKGILLGGAEPWQFTIIDDTLPVKIPANRSYIDIRLENGTEKLVALGQLKIKYQLDKIRKDELTLQLNHSGQKVSITPDRLRATYGDNRYIINLKECCNLKHNGEYKLLITSTTGAQYVLPFIYQNPDFTR